MPSSATRPPATVNESTETGSPGVPNRAPAAPLTQTGRASAMNRGAVRMMCRATASAPITVGRNSGLSGPRSEAEHHVGVEHPEQGTEVPVAGGGEERIDDPALHGGVRVRLGGGAHPAAGPAGELAGRLRGPVHDAADLTERHGED